MDSTPTKLFICGRRIFVNKNQFEVPLGFEKTARKVLRIEHVQIDTPVLLKAQTYFV